MYEKLAPFNWAQAFLGLIHTFSFIPNFTLNTPNFLRFTPNLGQNTPNFPAFIPNLLKTP